MPDRRRHRGPHPEDRELFAAAAVPDLRTAVAHLGWLLDRGYPLAAATALVGNRFALRERQRLAVQRCTCTAAQAAERRARRVTPAALCGATVWIDGFNVLTSVEAALAGGVLLIGRDGVLRDMASMHGSYRKVEETSPALAAIAAVLSDAGVGECRWLLDAPVSNSGRLKTAIEAVGRSTGQAWQVAVVPDPDADLLATRGLVVASADARILDGVAQSWDLAAAVVGRYCAAPWVVDLGSGDE